MNYDPTLTQGARNAIQVCLRLQPNERLTLIADRAASEIAAALIDQIDQVGAEYRSFVLEDLIDRPSADMPIEILRDLERSQVSIFAAQAETGELSMRMQMMSVVNRQRIRHGHMVNISKSIMLQGMRADFQQIDRLSSIIMGKARQAQRIKAQTPNGTDLVAEFSPKLNWVKTSGIISRDKWGNLPGGEIFTSPFNVNGVFVVDGVVGDYLCQKYGDLKSTPLRIEITDTRITHLDCANKDLLNEFAAYTRT
ncbi:MAG TPA: aminopeptidase, partial [Anaerolineae bacterium]|nr:aminopeptidase [Anaerolineae bacterium]